MNEQTVIILKVTDHGILVDAENIDGEDDMLNILLTSYVRTARKFIDEHPEECEDCTAYMMANRVVKSIERIGRDIHEKYETWE